MNELWNLDPLYKGFDDPAFASDMEALREMAAGYNAFAAELGSMDALEGLKQGIVWEEKLTELVMKLFNFAQLRQAANTRDTEAGSRAAETENSPSLRSAVFGRF